MATTKVDTAMDLFMDIYELYQMNTEELDEFQDMIDKRIISFRLGAIESEADKMQEFESDMKEEESENDSEDTADL
ncbi:hypothetical protein KBD33_05980 [Candidatus Gracilibacteria bacterium]|nr:hypothetical protein [Candidatus Gracilibacteria bacterium]